ncbi:MAG: MBL fold metallo-hydrolase, partial [Sulfurovaceae bacterium]|nr:MBL fold metallo-hydrolase [Sulfurovaceae bacterium]
MIKRIFHPIGQGAFYSERHENFNIVYDCGTAWENRGKTSIDKMIKQSFSKTDEIDILFISHFDYDHVSKIQVLRDHVKTIKKVVMPLLSEAEKKLLLNIYRIMPSFSINNLISNPEEFFGENTIIIRIKPSENFLEFIDRDIQNIDEIQEGGRIPSGVPLEKNFSHPTYSWVYIPHNHKLKARFKDLREALELKGFDIDKLQNDPKYTLNKIEKCRKLFKEVYDKLDGKINQNSMVVYSGAKKNNSSPDLHRHSLNFYGYSLYHFKDCYYKNKSVSCIYTGDTDLNVVKIKKIYQPYWNRVGTIQIPHHGDRHSFNKDILDNRYFICP